MFVSNLLSHSFEQQYHNGSILWSDEEDDEHNQSFLPIGLPPTQHRLTTPVTTSTAPVHIEDPSTNQEQQDDIDVVHIRPLNNLSAFNFDCQQMNEERLNETLSPKPTTRRNIFSTEPITDHRYQQRSLSPENHHKKSSSSSTATIERQSLSSSSSSSSSSSPSPPPQPLQSFTSDTSVIDTNWIEQERRRDAQTHSVPPSTLHDRTTTRQVRLFCSFKYKIEFRIFVFSHQVVVHI